MLASNTSSNCKISCKSLPRLLIGFSFFLTYNQFKPIKRGEFCKTSYTLKEHYWFLSTCMGDKTPFLCPLSLYFLLLFRNQHCIKIKITKMMIYLARPSGRITNYVQCGLCNNLSGDPRLRSLNGKRFLTVQSKTCILATCALFYSSEIV